MTLKLAKNLELPPSAITQTFAFLGKRGGGKTFAAMKLCEEMLSLGAQIIALDVVGVWYGLRVPKDAGGKSFDILVFGGLNADIEINPKAGKIIAQTIIDRNLSAVVDISQFISSEQTRFAYDFLTTIFEMKKRALSPIHIFLEEAQEIVPQNIVKTGGDNYSGRMLHAGERLVKLGRNFGIGCSLISQRPQEVNKKVLNQTEVMLAFQMTGIQERKTIAEWTQDKGSRDEMVSNLPSLEIGEALVWSPSWLKFDGKVKILPKITADVSATPEIGETPRNIQKLAPVDVEELRSTIEALTEDTEAETPKNLKKQIVELKRQLSEKTIAPVLEYIPPEKELSELRNFILDTKLWAHVFWNGAVDKFAKEWAVRNKQISVLIENLKSSSSEIPKPFAQPVKNNPVKLRKSSAESSPSIVLPAGEQTILTAIAQIDGGISREHLTILTGYKRSSRDAYIQRLKQRGLIENSGSDLVVTDEGWNQIGDDFEPLPTGDELRKYWLNNLPTGESLVLSHILNAYPLFISRDELSRLTNYKRSSRDAYLQRLSTRRLIISEPGRVKASEHLF